MKIGNLEVYGVIYKITNKVNGKVYIGQTTQAGGFKERYKGNLLNTTNEHLKRSIEKYGLENFSVIEVYDVAFSRDELNINEITHIRLCKSYKSEYGYNKTFGGEGATFTEEIREKISNSLRGRKLSEEHIKNMSRSLKGKQYKHTEETRKKFSEARKGKRTGGDNPIARAVLCVNTGIKFNTLTEAKDYIGLKSHVSISQACRGIKKTAGKHPVTGERLRWAYYDEYLKQQGA